MKRHLQLNWWKYAAVVLVSVTLWTSIFNLLAAPKKTQQIRVLYVGEGLNIQALQEELSVTLPKSIRQVTVTGITFDDASYKSKLSAYAVTNDLVIIQQSHLVQNTGQNIFARLTPEMLAFFPHTPAYTETVDTQYTLPFGFVLYDGQQDNRFSAHYTGTEPCYVFCSPDSVNFNTLNEKGKPGNDGALKALQYLLEMTK